MYAQLIFSILMFSPIHSQAEEIPKFSLDLIRHGDRMPAIELPKGTPYPNPKNLNLGDLTEEGAKQEFQLGQELRREYVNSKKLLPENFQKGEFIYVKSTKISRTINSAIELLKGLYPMANRPNPDFEIPIDLEKDKDGLLLVHPSTNLSPKENKLWKKNTIKISNKIQIWKDATGMDFDKMDSLFYCADNLFLRKLHNFPYPAGLTSENVEDILQLAEKLFLTKYRWPQMIHPMGNKFLKTLFNYFKQVKEGKTSLKYVLYLGHDSSIVSVLNTLGARVDTIPGFASRLNFTLFQQGNHYFYRVSLNENTLIIPKCKGTKCHLL